MTNRWAVLALVFLTRISLAMHFQALPPIATLLIKDLSLSYAQLGLLIGIFMLPGGLLALPGGVLGARFGSRAVMLAGLFLMTLGALVVANSTAANLPLGTPFMVAAAGRLLGGIGGVLLNVQLSKVVTDWFSGREMATAMGIQLSGWPFGIALSLATLGGLALATSWQTAIYFTAALSVISFVLVLLFYRDLPPLSDAPASPSEAPPPPKSRSPSPALPSGQLSFWEISRPEFVLSLAAGGVWLSWNVGYIGLMSFGPLMLIDYGYALTEAGFLISLVSWITLGSGPAASYLMDRTGRVDLLVYCGTLTSAALMLALTFGLPALPLILLMGLTRGPCAGGINTLPGDFLKPRSRSTGFGVFYTVYYVGLAFIPSLAGHIQDLAGTPRAPVIIAAGFAGLTALALLGFRRLQRRLQVAGG